MYICIHTACTVHVHFLEYTSWLSAPSPNWDRGHDTWQSRHRDKCSRWMDRDKLRGIHAWLLGIVKLLLVFSAAVIRRIFDSFLCLPPPAIIYVVSIPVHGNLHVVLKRMLSKGIATLSCPLLFLAFLFNTLAVRKWHEVALSITLHRSLILWEAWDLCWMRSIFCLLGPLTPLNGKKSMRKHTCDALSCSFEYRNWWLVIKFACCVIKTGHQLFF